MRMTRRSWLQAAGALSMLPGSAEQGWAAAQVDPAATLPAKRDFAPLSMTWLDAGGTHPVSLGAQNAVQQYMAARTLGVDAPSYDKENNALARDRLRERFATLINAKADEICIVQSTTAGEHLVVQALGIPGVRGRIVTDTLHYPNSFYLYEAMQKAGMDVVFLKPRDGRSIDLNDLDKAITRNTRLVSLALVSNVNGFQHDLKAVCDLAHSRGALVYADIAQAAGAVPVDVRAANVDFASCAGYKWLMGDFGVGLLYARADLLGHLKRTQFGWLQLQKSETHVYPFDPPGSTVADFDVRPDVTGHFATGTVSAMGIVQLNHSIEYVRGLGVENIQRYRQTLLDRARAGLEARGLECMTPPGARTPILTFIYKDAEKLLTERLRKEKIKVTLAEHRIRISPSVYNDSDDIDRLIKVLA